MVTTGLRHHRLRSHRLHGSQLRLPGWILPGALDYPRLDSAAHIHVYTVCHVCGLPPLQFTHARSAGFAHTARVAARLRFGLRYGLRAHTFTFCTFAFIGSGCRVRGLVTTTHGCYHLHRLHVTVTSRLDWITTTLHTVARLVTTVYGYPRLGSRLRLLRMDYAGYTAHYTHHAVYRFTFTVYRYGSPPCGWLVATRLHTVLPPVAHTVGYRFCPRLVTAPLPRLVCVLDYGYIRTYTRLVGFCTVLPRLPWITHTHAHARAFTRAHGYGYVATHAVATHRFPVYYLARLHLDLPLRFPLHGCWIAVHWLVAVTFTGFSRYTRFTVRLRLRYTFAFRGWLSCTVVMPFGYVHYVYAHVWLRYVAGRSTVTGPGWFITCRLLVTVTVTLRLRTLRFYDFTLPRLVATHLRFGLRLRLHIHVHTTRSTHTGYTVTAHRILYAHVATHLFTLRVDTLLRLRLHTVADFTVAFTFVAFTFVCCAFATLPLLRIGLIDWITHGSATGLLVTYTVPTGFPVGLHYGLPPHGSRYRGWLVYGYLTRLPHLPLVGFTRFVPGLPLPHGYCGFCRLRTVLRFAVAALRGYCCCGYRYGLRTFTAFTVRLVGFTFAFTFYVRYGWFTFCSWLYTRWILRFTLQLHRTAWFTVVQLPACRRLFLRGLLPRFGSRFTRLRTLPSPRVPYTVRACGLDSAHYRLYAVGSAVWLPHHTLPDYLYGSTTVGYTPFAGSHTAGLPFFAVTLHIHTPRFLLPRGWLHTRTFCTRLRLPRLRITRSHTLHLRYHTVLLRLRFTCLPPPLHFAVGLRSAVTGYTRTVRIRLGYARCRCRLRFTVTG